MCNQVLLRTSAQSPEALLGMELPPIVIPAYPYEGGLYWLLGEGSTRHDLSATQPGYYRNIYGPHADEVSRRASALVALFDEIEIAPADHALPEQHRYRSDFGYRHPDLRLSSSSAIGEWAEDGEELTKFLLGTRPDLVRLLQLGGMVDNFAKRHFVERVILQARLAIQKNAVLAGNELFSAVYQIVLPSMGAFIQGWPLEREPPKILPMQTGVLDAVGLYIPSNSFDGFCDIRSSAEVSKYAADFRSALGTALDTDSLEAKLRELMREARERRGISEHIKGGMQATSTWSGIAGAVAGLVPGAGTAVALAGLGADLASRRADARSQANGWYTFGSKLQQVSLDAVLDKGA